MTITFAELVDRLADVPVWVGIASDENGMAITLDGASSARSIRLPVRGDFDAAATELVLSATLRERITSPADLATGRSGRGWHVRGSWPEFAILWPVEAWRAITPRPPRA